MYEVSPNQMKCDYERGYGNFWILRRRSRATIRGAERAVSAFNSQVANGFPRLHPLRRVVMVKDLIHIVWDLAERLGM